MMRHTDTSSDHDPGLLAVCSFQPAMSTAQNGRSIPSPFSQFYTQEIRPEHSARYSAVPFPAEASCINPSMHPTDPTLFEPQPVDENVKKMLGSSLDQMRALLLTVPFDGSGGVGWTPTGATEEGAQIYWAPAKNIAKDATGVIVASRWKLPQTLSPAALFSFLTKDPKGYRVIDPVANRHGRRIDLPAADVPAHTTAHYTWACVAVPLLSKMSSTPKLVFTALNACQEEEGGNKLFVSLPCALSPEQQKACKLPHTAPKWQAEMQNLWASYVHKVGNDWWLTSLCWVKLCTQGLMQRLPLSVQQKIADKVDKSQKDKTLQGFHRRLCKAVKRGRVHVPPAECNCTGPDNLGQMYRDCVVSAA